MIPAELIAGLILKFGPVLAEQIFDLFHKEDPTIADWKLLFAKLKSYEELRNEAFAAAGKTPTPLPPV